MKKSRFPCFSADLSEEHMAAVHILPELPPCNHRRRLRRRLAGIFFPILIRPQKNSYIDASSTSRRLDQFCNRKPTFASDTSSVRKSYSDDDRGSDEVIFSSSSRSSLKTRLSSSYSSSLSSPIFTAPKSKEAVEAAAEKRCALYFFAVSLMVMVFFGRICAILWTASGLCFLPRRKPALKTLKFCGVETPAVAASTLPPSSDLRQRGFCECEKRRVVLEGLLGRSKRV